MNRNRRKELKYALNEMEENIMALDQASNTLCDLSNEVDPTIIVTTLQEVITTLEDLV